MAMEKFLILFGKILEYPKMDTAYCHVKRRIYHICSFDYL